jgi:hypothetical protein
MVDVIQMSTMLFICILRLCILRYSFVC